MCLLPFLRTTHFAHNLTLYTEWLGHLLTQTVVYKPLSNFGHLPLECQTKGDSYAPHENTHFALIMEF